MLIFSCTFVCIIARIGFIYRRRGFICTPPTTTTTTTTTAAQTKIYFSSPLSHKRPFLIELMCTHTNFTGKPSITASRRRWRKRKRRREREREKKAPILWKSPSPRRKRGGEEVGEGMPFLPHYTAVIYSSSPVLFSGIKTGCKFDS